MNTQQKVESQHAYFETGATYPAEFRIAALERMEQYIRQKEQKIFDALEADLGKAPLESYMTEVGLTLHELGYVKKRLSKWMRAKRVPTPLAHFPAKSYVVQEPYGVALIMSPWNYPFLLTVVPLIGAIMGGNCVMVKPSNYSANTSALLADMVAQCYAPEYVDIVLGGREQNQDLLAQKFNYIFFTGSIAVGKSVMEAAAANLTPMTLELGGKSPCIVDATADLKLAARRIVFGKFTNAGQTCIAPDYLLVEGRVKDELAGYLEEEIKAAFGGDPLHNPELPRVINEKHFNRLLGLMEGAHTVTGGQSDEALCKIAPTVLDGVTLESPIMGEEIFGPLLPMLTFERIEEVPGIIKAHDHPLALYIFSTDKTVQKQMISHVPSGGGCVNDALIHIATSRLPFGGVGQSGMGRYHGKYSFDTFSHAKGVISRGRMDLPMRYHPYNEKKFRTIRRFLH